MNNTKLVMSMVAAAVTLFAASAQAVTYTGTDVSFTLDTDLVGLFGTPTVSGNTLNFAPPAFSSSSADGAGYILVNQTINITVTANTGFELSGVSLLESGTYSLTGAGAYVEASGQLRVFDLDDPLNNEVTGSIVATLGQNTWSANPNAIIPVVGWGGADSVVSGVKVTLENLLITDSLNLGDNAIISKTFAGVTVSVSPVPEAHTYAMMLAGLGLVGMMVGRRNALSV